MTEFPHIKNSNYETDNEQIHRARLLADDCTREHDEALLGALDALEAALEEELDENGHAANGPAATARLERAENAVLATFSTLYTWTDDRDYCDEFHAATWAEAETHARECAKARDEQWCLHERLVVEHPASRERRDVYVDHGEAAE